jgi:hypothetical protein
MNDATRGNLSDEEVKQRYRGVVRRGRIFVFVVCPIAFGLVLAARALAASMGVALSGTVGLGLLLCVCVALAFVGNAILRCPACGGYVGSPPLHQWGKPRVCAKCGVALS